MDRTRKISKALAGTCLLVSTGNVIYTVSDRAAIVFVGRCVQGFGDFLMPVFYSEITKTFHKEECYRKLSILSSIFYVTYIFSPIIAAIFSAFDFRVFGISFNVYTIPPFLIMCGLLLGITSWLAVKNPKLVTIETDVMSNTNKNKNLLLHKDPAESSISEANGTLAKPDIEKTLKRKKPNPSEKEYGKIKVT